MGTQWAREGDSSAVTLPDVVPLDLCNLTKLSSDRGLRVVSDEQSRPESEWKHATSAWRVAIFEVTDDTAIVRVKTPVGRQRFYRGAQIDLQSVRPDLETATDWRRVD